MDMAFTVTFRSASPPPVAASVAEWLTERGEPFAAEGEELALLAVPVRFVASSPHLVARIDVTANLALSRVVDTLHDVSLRAGADLSLAGRGMVTRPQLELLLADEQDRLRIVAALALAREQGDADEVHKRLWAAIASLRPGHDDRWDTSAERVVELREVGTGIGLEQARWHDGSARAGDVVAVPVDGFVHCLVWRWLSEAYPRLAA